MGRFAQALFTLTVIALASAVRPAASAGAQASPSRNNLRSLRAGDTLRVWAVGPRLNGAMGRFTALGSDTLAMDDLRRGDPLPGERIAVPLMALRRVDVREPTHRSGWRTLAGVVLGGAGGLIVGAYAGVLAECGNSCSDNGEWGGLEGGLVGAAVGTLAGAIAGGVIGARPHAGWRGVVLSVR